MNDFDRDVKDLVNQYYADYQYITQMASFQAQIATQHQAWLNAAGAMVDRYGDFVLYNPPFKASTVILWVGPAVLFFGAVIAFYINLRRHKSQVAKTERALTPDEKRRAEALLRGDK